MIQVKNPALEEKWMSSMFLLCTEKGNWSTGIQF